MWVPALETIAVLRGLLLQPSTAPLAVVAVCIVVFQDPAVAIAFEENGEVAPVPLADPLIDQLFPLAEASVQDLGPEVILLRYKSISLTYGRL